MIIKHISTLQCIIFLAVLFHFDTYAHNYYDVQEFYYVRHGQTDHNIGLVAEYTDMPLNSFGQMQATCIEPLIASLPIKTICHSPLLRARAFNSFTTNKDYLP